MQKLNTCRNINLLYSIFTPELSKNIFQVTEFPETKKYGLKNMIGNVWEWTQDWWDIKHDATAKTNPVSFVVRGPDESWDWLLKLTLLLVIVTSHFKMHCMQKYYLFC